MRFADKDKFSSYLKKWQTLLRIINASLENAEEKQTSSRSLELWLSDLRDVAYDAEDIIDELTSEARRRQITEDPDAASPTCKVGRYFSAFFLRLNPSTAKFSTKMEFRLKSLTARLEEAVAMKDALSLVENDRGIRERPRTNSLVDESCVYGKECDKEIVLHLLMNDSDDSVGDSSVVSIVGMAGRILCVYIRIQLRKNKYEALFTILKKLHHGFSKTIYWDRAWDHSHYSSH